MIGQIGGKARTTEGTIIPADGTGENELAAKSPLLKHGAGDAPDTKPPASKRKPGRPADTDPKADQRVYDAWKSAHHQTYAGLARELKMEEREVRLAIDRHEKRVSREAK